MITKTIIKQLNVDVSNQYLDGTKIEANANKYKFVWKPTTYHQKLDIKVKQYLLELGYVELANKKEIIKAYELNQMIKEGKEPPVILTLNPEKQIEKNVNRN